MNPHSYRLKRRDFVHQGKIEIDVNERAVFIRTQGCFFVYTNSDCFLNSSRENQSFCITKIGSIQSWTLPKNIGYAVYAIHAIYIYTKRWGGNTIPKRDIFYTSITSLSHIRKRTRFIGFSSPSLICPS